MINKSEIIKAIIAHASWKQSLALAIKNRRCSLFPAKIKSDRVCQFGAWLRGLPRADKETAHFKKVDALHKKFHVHADKVLRLALRGRPGAAAKGLADAGSYAVTSNKLIAALKDWLKSLES